MNPLPCKTSEGAGGPPVGSSVVRIGVRLVSQGFSVKVSGALARELSVTTTSSFGPASRLTGKVTASDVSVGAGDAFSVTTCPPTCTTGVRPGKLKNAPLIVRTLPVRTPPVPT